MVISPYYELGNWSSSSGGCNITTHTHSHTHSHTHTYKFTYARHRQTSSRQHIRSNDDGPHVAYWAAEASARIRAFAPT
jgi:hypothetical protein